MNLPGIDGHALIKHIRNDASLPAPRIVAMSGVSEEIESVDCILDEGADIFLEKPVSNKKMIEAVNSLMTKGSARGK